MKKFYRISDEQMEALAVYMDPDIREAVAVYMVPDIRFVPCTNEEFVAQVFLRNGITKEIIEEVLNIDFGAFDETFEMIDLIKGYMHCNNIINSAKIKNTHIDNSEYCFYLNQFVTYVDRLKEVVPGKEPGLMDLKEDFPEIGYDFIEGFLFYTWSEAII